MLFELFSSARHSNTLKTGIVNNRETVYFTWMTWIFWLYLFNYFCNLSRIFFCISHMYNVLIRTGWILFWKKHVFSSNICNAIHHCILCFFLNICLNLFYYWNWLFLGSLCLHFRPLSTCQFIIKMIELNNCIILSHTLNSGGLFLITSI